MGFNRGISEVDQRIGPNVVRRDIDRHTALDPAYGVENLVDADTLLI